jgi:MoaA/NifB/PqqE/SkfB family radical SAM enzyme
MAEALLYADGAADHDPRSPQAKFAAVAAAIRGGATATVAPTPSNLWRLGRLARFALSLNGRGADLPDFAPQDHQQLTTPFHAHLELLRARLSETPVRIGEPSPDLVELLARYDEQLTPQTRSNLLRLLGALTDGCFIGPHTFHLDIANVCNTNCLFCGLHSPLLIEPKKPMRGRRFTEGWKTRRIDLELFEQLVDDLATIGAREDVLFSGEGEPLTHPQIFDMIRRVRRRGLALTLFSNGLLIDERAAEVFVETDLNILYWSLSAASPATFARLQPAHSADEFAPLVQRMSELVRRKRRKNNKPYIILAHVINRLNAHECEAAMDLAIETGVDAVRYQLMHSCGVSMDELLITRDQHAEVERQIAQARRKAEQAGVDIVANIDFQLERAGRTFELPPEILPYHWSHDLYRHTGCLAGWFFGRSFTDGRISFCCHDKIVGSLYRGGFRDLWFSERYRRLRQAAKAFDLGVNPDLVDESCGGPLLGPDCDYCGNYEFINQALADLERYRLTRLLRRDAPAWP